MIKIRSGKTWIIGLTKGNIDRLTNDNPMVLRHKEMGDITGDVFFIYKDTMEDLVAEIERITGMKVPGYVQEGGHA